MLWWRWLWRWLWPVVVLSAEMLQAAVLQAAQLLPTDELLPPFELQHLLCTASHVLRSGADVLRSRADLLCTVAVVRRSVDRDRSAAAFNGSGAGSQCLMCELNPVPGREPDSRGNPPVRVRFLIFFDGHSSRRHAPSRTR